MRLPATLLLTYQAEYERDPDMTIEDLCEKYDIQTKQLKGYTKWQKRAPTSYETNKLPEPTETNDIIVLPRDDSKQLAIPKTTKELLDDVELFKSLAVAHAVKFMKNDAEFAEVKEFKDMVAIVDSIEKSYKDSKDTGPTINVLIQNLTQKFKDTPDDC